MKTAIVVAGPAHLSGLVDSVHELFAEDGGRHDGRMDLGWPRRGGRQYYSALLSDDNALCLVAQRENTVVGHLVGRIGGGAPLRADAVTAVLESMRVAPEARRSGVGSALVARFGVWAGKRGARHFSVTAYSANSPAIAFYREHGFREMSVTLARS
ncbi:GNAT family N-acetyltransferase [Amycolatopsis saalfeldensis]|uniref:Acetyltransferase (GNAT) family protein n=1 Tax=Amycolatopsis saalfeldensis TaxID=394193 RepID=A0A1H8TBQ4_9PSEU|nr:GNAT family N-acetyltransferase [Amycolatopsis saalfeldensis]SEO87928.1 Acetyltransferase (GNAT) family protein [Amycolatopsis saalfeldensis]